MIEKDHMELGESGLIELDNGWYFNKLTKEFINPDGQIFSENDYESTKED